MAKAALPPKWFSEPTFYVSSHALERLRERSKAAAHMDDDSLGRVIDDAVKRAIEDKKCVQERTDKHGHPAKYVDLPPKYLDGMTVNGDICALVKKDERDPKRMAVVTILNKDMVPSASFSNSMAAQLSSVNIQTVERAEDPPPKEEKDEKDETYIIVRDGSVIYVGNKKGTEEALTELAGAIKVYKKLPFTIKAEIGE